MNASMLESALLQTHFDVIPFGIYVVDVATYELVFVNKHFRDALGAGLGRKCHEVLYESDAPCLNCRIPELLTPAGMPNGVTVVYDHYNERDERWAQMQEKTMGWPDGRVVKYSIAVDISELKETQNSLAEAHAELAIRNRELMAQNRILQENIELREHVERIARHDLKAPLSALIGLPQVLLDNYDLPDAAADAVRLIEQAGHSMLEMLNQSLVLFRLETGAYVLSPTAVDLADLARRTAARMATMPVARGRKIRVSLAGRPLAPGERLDYSGDVLLLGPMLQNLVVNGLEASPMGGEVTIDLVRDRDRVLVAVTNQGEVPEPIRCRMFAKYVTMGKRGGTGLGAYSAALAARAHGGQIELDAATPGWTTVAVILPSAPGVAP
ncbi:PAS/PAC sensor signal transduction histidine kinase [Solidesulfovibrio carbinoliphilus subsp. oakridgensis]|uniref:histidine kinase n=2 Tax=Solidesulfovibrio carbinoliphilus TaxID=345370 RepID=G7QD94_9BACT|nr:PAS/PAC sensor signal transduction histidine kinase [Solidesulfovibrio carbinoliphilus subsp. oakridgensis]